MGVMSRRVVPICGNLCFFCPALRARSRQPVKRYKKLLADIFPRSQDVEPNDRKIAKLCEYASRNPLRIPKITNYLEHRFYKDLRNEHIGLVKVVLCVYRKLLSSCKEQMPLFGSSLLGIIDILLDQNRWSEFQVLGCSALVDFINFQVDSTYMFNLESSIPKLCQLAQEVGDNDRAVCLRAAGLQALASMVHFMGEHSHISKDFDKIISVTLENYVDLKAKPQGGNLDRHGSQTQDQKIQGVVKVESENSSTELHIKIENGKLEPPLDASRSPSYWSKVCLHNMAGLAKEATTVRRVLEPFFYNFDSEDYWSLEKGLAFSVMMYLQLLLEEAGENSHLLLSILIKHLDHKNVVKQPLKQINIINVTTQLAKSAKQQASVAITGAITDLMKHLRKCIQYSAEASISGDGAGKLNADLQTAVENCILQLSFKVGDVGPILDMMAVVLENLPMSPIVARTTVFSVYRTAQIISSIPNVSYHKKAFPDALFHQLLLAMTHPDHETRVGAHYVFCTVLMPTLICPWLDKNQIHEISLEVSSVDVPLETRNGTVATTDERQDNYETKDSVETSPAVDYEVTQTITCQSLRKSCSSNRAMTCEKKFAQDLASLRLSGHQIGLLLSSIWVQAMSPENTPANFEAISHTFNIALLFTRSKTSSHAALVRCFQLAFSLRSSSFDQEGGLQPSRRRSLFTLASYMLVFSARAGNLPELIPVAKSYLTDKTVDPYLEPVEDIKLQAVSTNCRCYGTEEDDAAALESLSEINSDDQQLKEVVISSLMSRFDKLAEDELFGIKMQLLQGFSLDDAYPLGAALFMETPKPCSPPAEMEMQAFGEPLAPSILLDEAAGDDASGSRSGHETSLCVNSLDVLSVNQLLESVLDTAQQVASLPASNAPMPYDEVKSQCEALVTGKQQKMSVLHSMKQQQETKAIVSCGAIVKSTPLPTAVKLEDLELDLGMTGKTSNPIQFHDKPLLCSLEYGQQQSFRLPPSSPYDKFLKAAGC